MSNGRNLCETCRFYVAYRVENQRGAEFQDSSYGWCHRLPPAAIQPHQVHHEPESVFATAIWPMVEGPEDWCGAWRKAKTARP